MTLYEFKKYFRKFLENSRVNLGRKDTKTRKDFINEAIDKLDCLSDDDKCDKQINDTPLEDRVMMIKPTSKTTGLNAGKGVTAMTSSESMRADEQLNRSPFSQEKTKKVKKKGKK